jgi:hypothetical protein
MQSCEQTSVEQNLMNENDSHSTGQKKVIRIARTTSDGNSSLRGKKPITRGEKIIEQTSIRREFMFLSFSPSRGKINTGSQHQFAGQEHEEQNKIKRTPIRRKFLSLSFSPRRGTTTPEPNRDSQEEHDRQNRMERRPVRIRIRLPFFFSRSRGQEQHLEPTAVCGEEHEQQNRMELTEIRGKFSPYLSRRGEAEEHRKPTATREQFTANSPPFLFLAE